MTALDLLLIILGFLAVVPPSYIYHKNRGKSYKILMLLSWVAGPLWAFSIVLFRNSTELARGIFYAQIIYTISLLLGLFFYLFEQYFPRKKEHSFILNFIVYSIGGILLYCIWRTDLFVADVILKGTNIVVLGPIYKLWMVWMLGIFAFGLINILIDYRNLGSIEKKQLKYFILAIVLPVVGVVPTNAILPMLGIYEYIWIGPITMSAMTIVLTYGITSRYTESKYDFVRKFVEGIALLNYIFSISFLGVLTLDLIEKHSKEKDVFIYVIIYIILSMTVYLGGKWIIELFLKKALGDKVLDYTKVRDRYLNKTAAILNHKVLLDETVKYLYNTVSITWAEIVLLEKNKVKSVSSFGLGGDVKVRTGSDMTIFLDSLMVLNDIGEVYLNTELMEYTLNNEYEKHSPKELKRLEIIFGKLKKWEASEMILIKNDLDTQGFCLLGYKKNSSSSISHKERLLLLSILKAFSLGVSRATMHTQLEDVNKFLQEKVNEQTKELQSKIKLLQEARRKERDMIDIMGHELRTPATIVKLNVELLEQYINSNPKEFKKYLDRAKGAIENEIKLINTLLSSAKLEGDKIEINKERINIKNEIDMSLHGHEIVAKEKNLELINKTDINTPDIYGDKARTVEILNNLIDNAIKYTDKGSITVETSYDTEYVTVKIIDTGNGIPEEEIPKLGQKFYRINNYIGSNDGLDIVRPGGTGLGLYVTFRLVEVMGGKIWVESEVGKGSKFIFTLPLYKGVDNEIEDDSKDMFKRLGLRK